MLIDLDLIQKNSVETNAIVKLILEIVQQQINSDSTEPEGYVGTRKAQDFLDKYVDGFSMSYFEKLAANEELPVVKFGESNKKSTTNKYKISELKKWADDRMVSPTKNKNEAVNNIAESARKKQKK